MGFHGSEITFKESHFSTKPAQFVDDGLVAFAVGDRQIKPLGSQSAGNAKPDPRRPPVTSATGL